MMDEKIDCTVVRELLPGRVARGSVGRDGAGRLMGNEVRDEEGGLSKEVVIFCQPDLAVPILCQCVEAACLRKLPSSLQKV